MKKIAHTFAVIAIAFTAGLTLAAFSVPNQVPAPTPVACSPTFCQNCKWQCNNPICVAACTQCWNSGGCN